MPKKAKSKWTWLSAFGQDYLLMALGWLFTLHGGYFKKLCLCRRLGV
jgi:hypothetical protein